MLAQEIENLIIQSFFTKMEQYPELLSDSGRQAEEGN